MMVHGSLKSIAYLPAPSRPYMVFAVEMAKAACGFRLLGGAYSQPSDQRLSHRSPAALTLVLQIETMTEANQLPNRAELESAIRRWIDDSVWRREIKRAETGGLDFLESHEIEKMGRDDARELDGLFSVCLEHVRAAGEDRHHGGADRRHAQ